MGLDLPRNAGRRVWSLLSGGGRLGRGVRRVSCTLRRRHSSQSSSTSPHQSAHSFLPSLQENSDIWQSLLTRLSVLIPRNFLATFKARANADQTKLHLRNLSSFSPDPITLESARRAVEEADADVRSQLANLSSAFAQSSHRSSVPEESSEVPVEMEKLNTRLSRVEERLGGQSHGNTEGPTPKTPFTAKSDAVPPSDPAAKRGRARALLQDLVERLENVEARGGRDDERFDDLEGLIWAEIWNGPVGVGPRSWEELETQRDPGGRLRGAEPGSSTAAATAPRVSSAAPPEGAERQGEQLDPAQKGDDGELKAAEGNAETIAALSAEVRALRNELEEYKNGQEERQKQSSTEALMAAKEQIAQVIGEVSGHSRHSRCLLIPSTRQGHRMRHRVESLTADACSRA